jgi:hypothetical protein
MSRPLLVLEEVIAMLQVAEVPEKYIERFRKQAEFVLSHKPRREIDEITITSGYGTTSGHGHVELTLNDQLTQMDVKKAREVGLMFLEAAEAAMSDAIMVTLLEQVGLPPEARAGMLLHLREIRQGTRGTSHPS